MINDKEDVLGTIPVAMSDGSSRRMKIGDFVKYCAEAQRKHYDGIIEDVRQQLENMGLDDFTKSYLIAETKSYLDKDYERYMRELNEHAARGMRTDEALH